jgi:leucine dehydrogenase
MEEIFKVLESGEARRCLALTDKPSGLRAFLVLDDLTLGPAAGGVRTWRYATAAVALGDAMQLARAMTIKCALAGLAAGGGKAVVLAEHLVDRPRAFARLGEFVEELGGLFRTAGDLGTTSDDLAAMARKSQYVHTNEPDLCAAVARGVLRSLEACVEVRGAPGLANLKVAVQGCGSIGTAVARGLAQAGARVVVADIDAARAESLATEIDAELSMPDAVLLRDVDVVAPCAVGGVITQQVAREIKAWAVCGAANNILGDAEAERVMRDRGILYVPDFIASAGAVIDGIGDTVMKLSDRSPLIDKLRATTLEVLREARRSNSLPTDVARALARQRIDAARAD